MLIGKDGVPVLGVPAMDDDHKHLFWLLNHLFSLCDPALVKNVKPSDVEIALRQMIDDCKAHFAREEEMMVATGFDGADVHKEDHAAYIRCMEELRVKLATGFRIEDLSLVQDVIVVWFLNHIVDYDKLLADFVLERQGASACVAQAKQAAFLSP